MLNPFADDAWSEATLTDEINQFTATSRDVSAKLDWEEKGVRHRTVIIDMKDIGIDIIDDAPYNGVPQELTLSDGDPIALVIPSHPARSVVMAEEVAERRAPGTEDESETIEARKNEHYDLHTRSHNLSWEVDRIGALQGQILRRDGSVKQNLAVLFGQAPQVIEFDFDDADADIIAFFLEVKDMLEAEAQDLMIEGWQAWAPPTMFRKSTNNKYLKETYRYIQQNHLFSDKRGGFPVAEGITLSQYSPNFLIPNSGGRYAFPTNRIIMAPIAPGNYQTRFAPRQDLVSVGTEGKPIYMKPKILEDDEGLRLKSESNHTHYVRRLKTIGLIEQEA